jgi:hypothetical protein
MSKKDRSEIAFLRQMHEAREAGTRVGFDVDLDVATMLVAIIQLALRHPEMPERVGRVGRIFVDHVIDETGKDWPEIAEVLRRGGNPAYDVPTKAIKDAIPDFDLKPTPTPVPASAKTRPRPFVTGHGHDDFQSAFNAAMDQATKDGAFMRLEPTVLRVLDLVSTCQEALHANLVVGDDRMKSVTTFIRETAETLDDTYPALAQAIRLGAGFEKGDDHG